MLNILKKVYIVFLLFLSFSAEGQQIISYKPGEKIYYDIKYGVITGGVASMEINSEILYDKEVWHARMIGKTTGITDAIYRVLDIYESYIDPQTELPVKSIRNIKEGRYRKYNEVLFDHKTRSDSAILTSDLTGIHITQKGMHDIISCFYYLRNHVFPDKSKLVKGEFTTIMTWFADELYPIRLRYMGTDEVRTGLGKIVCHKFNPVTEKGRLFNTEDGVSFWFTADKNFLPVKIRFDIFVGSFTVEMTSVEGLAYPLEIKKK